MKLFVDDIRNPPDMTWCVVRTFEGAITYLKHNVVEVISLDHDLGKRKSGYDIAKWIEEQVFLHQIQAPEILCHSQNPVGKKNILAVGEAIERFLFSSKKI